ncbi:MAG TPA: hypothetical protein VFH61_13930 [Thermoleophilia bacterium]|nr:hypothetical protein [Thermoleophilia bacterium]
MAKKSPDALRVISNAKWTAGGLDNMALEAQRRMKRLPENFMSQHGLIQNNALTDHGARFINALDAHEKPMARAFAAAPTQILDETAEDFARRSTAHQAQVAKGHEGLSALQQQLHAINPDAAKAFSPDVAREYAQRRPATGARAARFAGDMIIGRNPLQVMKQRYQMGGIFGRGGLVRGEMSIDPDVMRAYRNAKDPTNPAGYGGMAMPVAMDALNKGFAYAMPAGMVYEAVKTPVGAGESRAENIGGTLGDALGWSVGSPFGMISGGAFAAPFTAAGKAIGRKLDPNYRPAMPPLPEWADQAGERARAAAIDPMMESMQGHPVLAGANVAGDVAGHVRGRVSEWGQRQQAASPVPDGNPVAYPGRNQ